MNSALRLSKKKNKPGERSPEDGDRQIVDAAAAQAEALRWVVLLHTGDGAPHLQAEFVHWRDSHPVHAAAMREAQDWWRQIGHCLAQRPPPDTPPVAHSYAYEPPVSTLMGLPDEDEVEALVPTRSGRPALAAAIVLALTAGLWWSVDRADEITGIGESRTVRLADGSSVQLDTDTAVDIDLLGAERRVALAHGEVFFDVASDAQRPFVIEAGIGQVRVHGTAFSVRHEDGAVSVTVERGTVEVGGGALDVPVRLEAGQRIRFDRLTHSGVQPVVTERALAWRGGRLQFKDEPLGAVLAEIRRYDPRVWFVPEGVVAQARLSTTVPFAQLDGWLDALPQALPVEVLRIGPVVWVRERATPAG